MRVRIHSAWTTTAATTCLAWAGLILAGAGCTAPIGADRAPTSRVHRQIHQNPVGDGVLSAETRFILHRFEQGDRFEAAPDEALQAIQQKLAENREPDHLFALSELSYLAGERLRRSVKPWETRDARDYYLASAVYAWLFLFDDAEGAQPGAFDHRFRDACELYNFALGRSLTGRRATNVVADLSAGVRSLPSGRIDVACVPTGFPWPASDVSRFLVADQFLVPGPERAQPSTRAGRAAGGRPATRPRRPLAAQRPRNRAAACGRRTGRDGGRPPARHPGSQAPGAGPGRRQSCAVSTPAWTSRPPSRRCGASSTRTWRDSRPGYSSGTTKHPDAMTSPKSNRPGCMTRGLRGLGHVARWAGFAGLGLWSTLAVYYSNLPTHLLRALATVLYAVALLPGL